MTALRHKVSEAMIKNFELNEFPCLLDWERYLDGIRQSDGWPQSAGPWAQFVRLAI